MLGFLLYVARMQSGNGERPISPDCIRATATDQLRLPNFPVRFWINAFPLAPLPVELPHRIQPMAR
ncbi:hypothetical protein N619_29990 [Ectopseudomonas oleovorans]|nr:hypothetical protein N619_29990 [Pseudomonas oleovorans]